MRECVCLPISVCVWQHWIMYVVRLAVGRWCSSVQESAEIEMQDMNTRLNIDGNWSSGWVALAHRYRCTDRRAVISFPKTVIYSHGAF